MADQWMTSLRLSTSAEEFQRLPRHPSYRYRYEGGVGAILPAPRFGHACLDLPRFCRPGPLPVCPGVLRPLEGGDWESLPLLFAQAFAHQQPYAGLQANTREVAARETLHWVRTGGEGPLIERACLVAHTQDRGKLLGATLLTLLPLDDPTDQASYYWRATPPADAVGQRLGRPHLTWIFVSPYLGGHGIGSALLHASARILLEMGFTELFSTFLIGNDSSMLWHWRRGFQLLPEPRIYRNLR
jgi:hypothetical protein